MTGTSGFLVASVVGGLVLLGPPSLARAQSAGEAPVRPVGQSAAPASGSVHGVLKDEAGAPVVGATVTARSSHGPFTFDITRLDGRYDLRGLPPGLYVLEARRQGTLVSSQTVVLAAGERAPLSMTIGPARNTPRVLAAGLGAAAEVAQDQPVPAEEPGETTAGTPGHDDHSETAWRIRHGRRSILRETTAADDMLADGSAGEPVDLLGRAVASPARIATSLLADTPFSGQVNFLTASSLDHPAKLFTVDNLSRGVAYVRVGAPVGAEADWTVQGAVTQADISSWIVAGSYTSQQLALHQYNVGMSYSTQRYDGGNPLALREVAEGSRNVGELYGYDAFRIAPAFMVTYGARYARYDYLDRRALISPSVELGTSPADGVRLNASWSRRAHAPGAEEFLPPGDSGIWLPPQRTFSPIDPRLPFEAERVSRLAVEVERDFEGSTIAFRAFREQVEDQLLTLFGADLPGSPTASIGHYVVGNVGDFKTTGCSAEFRATWTENVRSTIAYSIANARLSPDSGQNYVIVLAPSAMQPEAERVHDVSTRVEAEVPETSTRVLVVYRANTAFAHPARTKKRGDEDRRSFDSRFDVQVRQRLPFMNFSNAKVEALVAVRSFFRDTEADQSSLGELFVVRPPKRIVGGVTLHF